ncbi:MAG: hypothetical protein CM15mP127_13480 [Gammaproteobacteria bacterium]|nr:MAG: hypothetical protein CM15mP127_13480 [Gammaproteobacteria bacterium]
MEGRASGTFGDEMAKDYIKNSLKMLLYPQKEQLKSKSIMFPQKEKWNLKPEDMTVKTYNILTLPGNDPILKDEYVVIGGHYDGGAALRQLKKLSGDKIYNNADDNASGTATVLELFEKYASTNSNKRTLVSYFWRGRARIIRIKILC